MTEYDRKGWRRETEDGPLCECLDGPFTVLGEAFCPRTGQWSVVVSCRVDGGEFLLLYRRAEFAHRFVERLPAAPEVPWPALVVPKVAGEHTRGTGR